MGWQRQSIQGLQAVIRHSGLNKNYISAYHIGFVIGPCFNAAGRLDRADTAIRLLQTTDREEAERWRRIWLP